MKLEAASIDIGPLRSEHDRAGFECGEPSLDRYIREQARQDASRGVARVFIATPDDDASRILGYYTLSATSIGPRDLPETVAKSLPRVPIPAALIGRLAVDRTSTGRGLGRILLADAVLRAQTASESLAVAALVVDPINDGARAFYRAFGFEDALAPHSQMFLMRSLKKPK